MEESSKKEKIKAAIAICIVLIIIIFSVIVAIIYQIEGEPNMPFKISKLRVISTAEGIENNIDGEIELLKNIYEYDFSNKFYEEIIEAQYKYILKEYENQNYEKAYLYLDNVIENEKYKNNSELLEKAKVIRYYKALYK